MTGETILFLVLGAAAGGFINGLSGTGTALFALGFYLAVMEPVQAVAIVALMSVLVGLQGLWLVREQIAEDLKRLARFVVPGLVGVPVGVAVLSILDAGILRTAIAFFLIVYGIYFGMRSTLPSMTRSTPWIDSSVGFLGGVFGGAASVSGALPSMWLSLRPWPKARTRAVLQPFNAAILGTTIFLLARQGAYDETAIKALVLTIPCGLLAGQVGIAVFRKLSDDGFRRLLIALTFLMGVGILIAELF